MALRWKTLHKWPLIKENVAYNGNFTNIEPLFVTVLYIYTHIEELSEGYIGHFENNEPAFVTVLAIMTIYAMLSIYKDHWCNKIHVRAIGGDFCKQQGPFL